MLSDPGGIPVVPVPFPFAIARSHSLPLPRSLARFLLPLQQPIVWKRYTLLARCQFIRIRFHLTSSRVQVARQGGILRIQRTATYNPEKILRPSRLLESGRIQAERRDGTAHQLLPCSLLT